MKGRAVAKLFLLSRFQSRQKSVKVIGKGPTSLSDIGFSLSRQESKHSIVKNGKHLWCMSHTELGLIFMHRRITSIMQSVFNAPLRSSEGE